MFYEGSSITEICQKRMSSDAREFCARLIQLHLIARNRGEALLTPAGFAMLQQLAIGSQGSSPVESEPAPILAPLDVKRPLPFWDASNRRLWLGELLVKEFRRPATNQITVLWVFQEEGWTGSHIDDPLPRDDLDTDADAKRRLHDTIRNLNRGMLAGTIRFHGDGTGEGVIWEYEAPV